MITDSDEHNAYIRGRIDGIKEAIAELERGPLWNLRDAIAYGLHWFAMHIEPKGPDR